MSGRPDKLSANMAQCHRCAVVWPVVTTLGVETVACTPSTAGDG